MADNNTFELHVITPDRMFYEGQAEMVEFNTTEGEIGVYPGHIPLTVIIKPGILKIYEPGTETEKEAALHAGFAEILPDKITILAEIVEWPNEIDEERAESALHRAEERLQHKTPDIDVVRAEAALLRAMTRIEVLK
ncbi:MAG: ATP synthase F1 subunit epsilon [Lachnospiraceae bacterium]|nr:ATP synthase F1 subunit epsilon [Lachnospiraceae bacterium]